MMAITTMSTLPILSVNYGDERKNVCPYKVGNMINIPDKYFLYYSMLFTGIIVITFEASISDIVDSGVIYRVETS